MARVRAGEVQLGWREWGEGDVTVVFIHGNLASKDWIELAAPLFPSGVRVIGIDWRGCGESDRPPPAADFSNYSMRQHALDMLAALDELKIPSVTSPLTPRAASSPHACCSSSPIALDGCSRWIRSRRWACPSMPNRPACFA